MHIIYDIAGIIYNFFTFIGKVCTSRLVDVFDGITITASNPFNNNTWIVHTNLLGDGVESVGSWLLEQLGLGNFLVFDGLLFLTASIFVVVFVVRLFSSTTPD